MFTPIILFKHFQDETVHRSTVRAKFGVALVGWGIWISHIYKVLVLYILTKSTVWCSDAEGRTTTVITLRPTSGGPLKEITLIGPGLPKGSKPREAPRLTAAAATSRHGLLKLPQVNFAVHTPTICLSKYYNFDVNQLTSQL